MTLEKEAAGQRAPRPYACLHRIRWVLALPFLALGACEPPKRAAENAHAPRTPLHPNWRGATVDAGAQIAWIDGGGPRLTLRCVGRPASFTVRDRGLQPIGSEDRLTMGFGEALVVLVADLSDVEEGVYGSAAVPLDLGFLLARRDLIRLSYGAQTAGPYPPPPERLARAFAGACLRR